MHRYDLDSLIVNSDTNQLCCSHSCMLFSATAFVFVVLTFNPT